MNMLMAMSILRSILLSIGGYFVGTGKLSNDVLQQLVPAIIVIVTAAWGAFDKKDPK